MGPLPRDSEAGWRGRGRVGFLCALLLRKKSAVGLALH